MRVLIVAVLVLLGCAGCVDTSESAVRSITYYRDPAAPELCFASGVAHYVDQISSVFSYVPCDKVPPGLLHNIEVTKK